MEMENEPGVLEDLSDKKVLNKDPSKEEIRLALKVQNSGKAP
jgi:hypothetical protein